MNSAQIHCLLWKSQQVRAEPKIKIKNKKIKREIRGTKTRTQQSVESKHSQCISGTTLLNSLKWAWSMYQNQELLISAMSNAHVPTHHKKKNNNNNKK